MSKLPESPARREPHAERLADWHRAELLGAAAFRFVEENAHGIPAESHAWGLGLALHCCPPDDPKHELACHGVFSPPDKRGNLASLTYRADLPHRERQGDVAWGCAAVVRYRDTPWTYGGVRGALEDRIARALVMPRYAFLADLEACNGDVERLAAKWIHVSLPALRARVLDVREMADDELDWFADRDPKPDTFDPRAAVEAVDAQALGTCDGPSMVERAGGVQT